MRWGINVCKWFWVFLLVEWTSTSQILMPLCEVHSNTKYINQCRTYNDGILNLPDSSRNELPPPTNHFQKEIEGPQWTWLGDYLRVLTYSLMELKVGFICKWVVMVCSWNGLMNSLDMEAFHHFLELNHFMFDFVTNKWSNGWRSMCQWFAFNTYNLHNQFHYNFSKVLSSLHLYCVFNFHASVPWRLWLKGG
jgi:hypothetical protein